MPDVHSYQGLQKNENLETTPNRLVERGNNGLSQSSAPKHRPSKIPVFNGNGKQKRNRSVIKAESESEKAFEAEKILGMTEIYGDTMYLIKWKGMGLEKATIVKAKDAYKICPSLIIDFYEANVMLDLESDPETLIQHLRKGSKKAFPKSQHNGQTLIDKPGFSTLFYTKTNADEMSHSEAHQSQNHREAETSTPLVNGNGTEMPGNILNGEVKIFKREPEENSTGIRSTVDTMSASNESEDDFEPEEILGKASATGCGGLVKIHKPLFLIKGKRMGVDESRLVTVEEAHNRYPNIVSAFYESKEKRPNTSDKDSSGFNSSVDTRNSDSDTSGENAVDQDKDSPDSDALDAKNQELEVMDSGPYAEGDTKQNEGVSSALVMPPCTIPPYP